jgi:outer membrane protein assembly factor BamA
MIMDKRSNILTPQYGSYGELSVVSNNLDDRWCYKFKLDLRKYITFNANTFSFRLLNESVSGSPPFYEYTLFGGDKNARGYYYGRFREKNLMTLQGEYRSPLWWRFGLALFGGISKVYPSIDTMSVSHLKPNYGFGLRFLTDTKENINLRLDYSIGFDGQDGFYVYFGESF